MRKYLFLAIALVAGVLAFTSCEKNDPNAIKGIKFCCDIDRGITPTRQYLYFGEKDDFEWGWEIYEDQARTKKVSAHGDYGTYVLDEQQQHMCRTPRKARVSRSWKALPNGIMVYSTKSSARKLSQRLKKELIN